MNVVPFSAQPDSDGAAPGHIEAVDAHQRMFAVKRKLEEASAEVESLQAGLAAQQELEQLLKLGRTHLQDLRTRLQQAAAERDGLKAELSDSRSLYERDTEQLRRQMEEVRGELQNTTGELQNTTTERNQLASQLEEKEAAHMRFAEEREDERNTFTRLLNEASSREREILEERAQQQRQIDALLDAATRAQALAHEIVRTHESTGPAKPE
jgi:chromosome segregation ATPase